VDKKKATYRSHTSSPGALQAIFQAACGQAAAVEEPFVQAVLAEAEAAMALLQQSVDGLQAAQQGFQQAQAQCGEKRAALLKATGKLVYGLLSQDAGPALVDACRARDKVLMAQHLVGRVTPAALGPNAALLDALQQALSAYQAAEGAWSQAKATSAAAAAGLAEEKRVAHLAIQAVQSAAAAGRDRQALARRGR
jgi:hypothetical protein